MACSQTCNEWGSSKKMQFRYIKKTKWYGIEILQQYIIIIVACMLSENISLKFIFTFAVYVKVAIICFGCRGSDELKMP